jgi:hypothetical protein
MDEKQKLEAEIKALIKEKQAQNKALKRFIEALATKTCQVSFNQDHHLKK